MRGVSAMKVSFLALGTFYCDRATGFVTPHAAAAVACATRRRPSDAFAMAAEVRVGRTRRAKKSTHTQAVCLLWYCMLRLCGACSVVELAVVSLLIDADVCSYVLHPLHY